MNAQLQTSTALTLSERVTRALAIQQTESELKALAAKTTGITTVTNLDGRRQVHTAAMVLADERIAITKAGKAARDDANAFSKAVIAEEKRLVAIVEPEERRLLSLRDTYDAEQKRIAREKAEAEEQRVSAIKASIDSIRHEQNLAFRESSAEISKRIEDLTAIEIGEDYAEFSDEATQAKAASLNGLAELLAKAQGAEAEAARLRQERAEFERQQAEARAIREQEDAARKEREAKEAAERQRRQRLDAAIRTIRYVPRQSGITSFTPGQLRALIERQSLPAWDPAAFGDDFAQIVAAEEGTLADLRQLLANAEERAEIAAAWAAQQRRADEDRIAREVEARRREIEAQLKVERAITLDEEEPVAGCRYNGELVTEEMLSEEAELSDAAAQMSTQAPVVRDHGDWWPGTDSILHTITTGHRVSREAAVEWVLRAACELGEMAVRGAA